MIHYTAIASCFARANAWGKSGDWVFPCGPLIVIYGLSAYDGITTVIVTSPTWTRIVILPLARLIDTMRGSFNWTEGIRL
jgi:hypothetical protein